VEVENFCLKIEIFNHKVHFSIASVIDRRVRCKLITIYVEKSTMSSKMRDSQNHISSSNGFLYRWFTTPFLNTHGAHVLDVTIKARMVVEVLMLFGSKLRSLAIVGFLTSFGDHS